jgi:hypothetical protein
MINDLKESLAGLQAVEKKILVDIENNPNDMYFKSHIAGVRNLIAERENQIKDLETSK